MSEPFIVLTLPRSRSYWLSKFLTFGAWKCWHDVSAGMRTMDDVARFFARPDTGTVETAVAPGWALLAHSVPGLRTAVVHRPVDDVLASLARALADIPYDAPMARRFMLYEARLLRRISVRPGVLSVEFADLEQEDACSAIFEHCLRCPMPRPHWEGLRHRNIQVDLRSVIAYRVAHRFETTAFKRAAKAELWALARGRQIGRHVEGSAA
jgi:hypothetical protein